MKPFRLFFYKIFSHKFTRMNTVFLNFIRENQCKSVAKITAKNHFSKTIFFVSTTLDETLEEAPATRR